MANTPKYTFTAPDPYNAAITGGMTALGGILAEKASSKKSSDQLSSFANVLRQQGLVGDAMIYDQMALAQEPDYVSAALTGKPTQRSLTEPFDHALKILDSEATRKARIAEAGIRAGESTDYRQRMAERDDTSDERNIYKEELSKLRAESIRIDEAIAKARDIEGDEDRVANLKIDKKKVDDRIAELETSVQTTLQQQRDITKKIGGGSTGTKVGTEGAVTLPNGGEAPLPTKEPTDSSEINKGSGLLDFSSTTLPSNRRALIGEQEPPAGAVATPAVLPPFDPIDQISNEAEKVIGKPKPTIAPLPAVPQGQFDWRDQVSKAAAVPTPTPAIPPTPDVTVREPVNGSSYKDVPYPARVGGLLDESSFDRNKTKGLLNLNPLNPEPEVRRALPVDEVPSEESMKKASAEAEVAKQQTATGTPKEEEVDPDRLAARERLQSAKATLVDAYKDVAVDENGVSLIEKLVKDVKRVKDLTTVERRIGKYKDTKGQWPFAKAAIDAGERARGDMPDGDKFYTSVKINPQNGLHTWYLVKKGSMTFDKGVWHGEDGTIWYPDPKTGFMAKKIPGEKPVWETKLNNPNAVVSKAEFESDMAKLSNSEFFNAPEGENISAKSKLRGATGGEGMPEVPQPPPGTDVPAATPVPPAAAPTTPASAPASAPTGKMGTDPRYAPHLR